MIKLFKYENFRVKISEEALTLKPFKIIWNRDKSKEKDKAISELSYIYFFADPRSDYQLYLDEEERSETIKRDLGLNDKWKPDKDLKRAIEFYKSFKPLSSLLLEDTRILVDNLRNYLRTTDLSERDDKGKPIYTPNIITATVKQIPDLIKSLDEAEKALYSELLDNSRMRGNKEKSLLEDGVFQ